MMMEMALSSKLKLKLVPPVNKPINSLSSSSYMMSRKVEEELGGGRRSSKMKRRKLIRVTNNNSGLLQTLWKKKPMEEEDSMEFESEEEVEESEEESEAMDEEEEEEDSGIVGGIEVPREKYIPISKSQLLAAILASLFSESQSQEKQQFALVAQCLDSILHAEHKTILEEMRTDYYKINYSSTPFTVAVASRFQHAFLKLLQDAQYQQLSARDLLLTSALNTDYLLTLPIYVDWKKASESNAIIFRRGYATETQKGLLIGEKLDYLQSKLLQRLIFSLSKPLAKIGMLIKEVLKSASQTQELQVWIARVKLQMEELFPQQSYSDAETHDTKLASNQQSKSDLPIWLAAQKAVPRYEGLLSSVGPRGRLL